MNTRKMSWASCFGAEQPVAISGSRAVAAAKSRRGTLCCKRMLLSGMCLVSAGALCLSGLAAELVVPAEGRTVASSASYEKAQLSGTLTVAADVSISGLTEVKDGGAMAVNVGKIFTTRNISIDAGVEGTDGVYNFAKLNGRLASGSMTNETASTFARIEFSGGNVWWDNTTLSMIGTIFHTKSGNGFVLSGSDEQDVVIYVNNASRELAKGDGVVRFTGKDVNCIIRGGAGLSKQLKLGTATIDWQNAGDLVVSGGGMMTCNAGNQLPFENGCVRIDDATTTLNLNGFPQKLRGLISKGVVSTTGADTTLSFGACDQNGELSAVLGEHVQVAKTGSGTLAVSDACLNDVSVEAGTMEIDAGNSGRVEALNVTVSPGAVVVVDGGVFAVRQLNLLGDAKLTTKNGGFVEYAVVTNSVLDVDTIGTTENIAKTGTGTLMLKADASISGSVWVKEGTVGFSAKSCAAEWWRLTMKKAYTHSTYGSYPALGRFHLVNANGDFESSGITAGSPLVGAEPSTLPNSKVTTLKQNATGTIGSMTADGPQTLFATSTSKVYGLVYLNDEPDPMVTNSWETVVFRLSSDQHAVAGYKMRSAWTDGRGMPVCSWSLEASFNGIDWTLVDERMDEPTAPTRRDAIWYNSGNSDDVAKATPYPLAQAPGACGLSASSRVRVDAGARLDFSMVDVSSRGVGELTVDCRDGAGEIVDFVPMVNGRLYLLNAQRVKGGMDVPITLNRVSDMGNLASWSVYSDGKLTNKKLVYRDGRLQIERNGLVLVVR